MHSVFVGALFMRRRRFQEKVCDADMQTIWFSVTSVSHAMRGQRLLAAAGIRSAVRRREVDPATGCGYRLELLDEAQAPRARRLLLEAGLLPGGGRR